MEITLPKQVKELINNSGFNKTKKVNILKIYAALWGKEGLEDRFGYFPIASTYLRAVNERYIDIIRFFIDNKIIEPYTVAKQDENNVFNTRLVKTYDTTRHKCCKYRFLIDTTEGEIVDVDMISNIKTKWYDILKNSLLETKHLWDEWDEKEINISRCNYGRRVHHSAIREYKTSYRGFYTIDAACSQPRLLFNELKNMGIVDTTYNEIFESGKDFYDEIKIIFNLKDRKDAKELFLFWLNGNGYVPKMGITNVFPVVSAFLKSLKKNNYKNSGSFLQRVESKIWIDDLLENIPVEFAIPIHDSFIVKENDVDLVLAYCKSKYSDIVFKKEKIK